MKNLVDKENCGNRYYFRYVNKNQKCDYGKSIKLFNSCYKMSLAIYLEEEDLLKILKVIKK
jgi:hypothetical protein